jgi:hypothetical protein
MLSILTILLPTASVKMDAVGNFNIFFGKIYDALKALL